jgi:hypothetical protein
MSSTSAGCSGSLNLTEFHLSPSHVLERLAPNVATPCPPTPIAHACFLDGAAASSSAERFLG